MTRAKCETAPCELRGNITSADAMSVLGVNRPLHRGTKIMAGKKMLEIRNGKN